MRAGLMLLVLLLGACGEPAPPKEAPKPAVDGASISFPQDSPQLAALSVKPVEAARELKVELTARLVWDEDRTIRIYPPFAGKVTRIFAQPGDAVKAGQTLALIAAPDFGQAQADAGRAQADFVLAGKNLARVKELYENGVAPRKDLAQVEAEHARASSELARSQSRVRLYGGTGAGDQTLALKSPLAGVVVERNINPGQELRAEQAGAALFVVTDPSRLWIQIDAREGDVGVLKPGAAIKFRSSAYPDQMFEARLDKIADFIDPQTRTIKARGSLANPDRKLKGEMLVTAVVTVDSGGALSVPARAVIFAAGKHYAFVERGLGRFERIEVRTGAERGGKLLVHAGLEAGQKVVAGGALLLQQLMKPGAAGNADSD